VKAESTLASLILPLCADRRNIIIKEEDSDGQQ
jgi:hypothetical protein